MKQMVVCVAMAAGVAFACSEAEAPAPRSEGTTASPAVSEPATVADIFPPGEGRDLVLNSCGSCHNVACSAIGQRPAARWAAIQASHKDQAGGADLDVIFGYLRANFGENQPEPNVPARFLEGGCTPF